MDLNDIKKKLKQYKGKYDDRKQDKFGNKAYDELNEGIQIVEHIREKARELSDHITEGDETIREVSLVAGKSRSELNDASEKTLSKLIELYQKGEKRVLPNIFRKKHRTLSLAQGYRIIENTVDSIPEKVDYLAGQLDCRRDELLDKRKNLRTNVEDLINSRGPLRKDIGDINDTIHEMENRYTQLERKREENSEAGISTDRQTIDEIDRLEELLEEAKQTRMELKTQEENIDGDVTLMNNQIARFGQLLEALNKTQTTVSNARSFVNTQIQYARSELRTQGTQIQALGGVNQASEFLLKLSKTTENMNRRIADGTEYLDRRIKEIRSQVIDSRNIYGESIESGKMKLIEAPKEDEDKKDEGVIDVEFEIIEEGDEDKEDN